MDDLEKMHHWEAACLFNGLDADDYLRWARYEGLSDLDAHVYDYWSTMQD